MWIGSLHLKKEENKAHCKYCRCELNTKYHDLKYLEQSRKQEFFAMKIVIPNCVIAADASGSGQLQANPHVAGPWPAPGKPTRTALTTMGSNDLVVGDQCISGKRADVAR